MNLTSPSHAIKFLYSIIEIMDIPSNSVRLVYHWNIAYEYIECDNKW